MKSIVHSSVENWCERRGSLVSRDMQGRVKIEDQKVIRIVTPELLKITRKMESSGGLQRLVDAGLIPTEIIKDPETGEEVLSHEFLPFVTYPQEWTLSMLRDASLCTLDVAIELASQGLCLHDSHPWNVSFLNDQPKYLDFSSIKPGRLDQGWLNIFFQTSYLPLWLHSRYLSKLSWMIAHEPHPLGMQHGTPAVGRYLFGRKKLGRFALGFNYRAWRIQSEKDPLRGLISLRKHLESINLRRSNTEWAQYYEPGADFDDVDSFSGKGKAVHSLLSKLPRGRLVDFACNHGWFSALSAHLGHTVLGIDYDYNAVDIARSERAGRFDFTVACMNLRWPTPQQGEFLQLDDAFTRWRCDTALMIALTHHLVLRQELSFNALAMIPADHHAKHVIAEWIPPDDFYVRDWVKRGWTKVPDWYCEENFVGAFRRKWPNVKKIPSDVPGSDGQGCRQMFLFRE